MAMRTGLARAWTPLSVRLLAATATSTASVAQPRAALRPLSLHSRFKKSKEGTEGPFPRSTAGRRSESGH